MPIVLWAFGFATSVLLIGLWGRTVVVDSATVEETARTVVDAELATERVNEWLADGIVLAASTDSETAQQIAAAVATKPEFTRAVDVIVTDVVAGLFADVGEDPVVRVADALAPVVPVVESEFASRDIPVETEAIENVLASTAVIELDTGEAATVAAIVSDARVILTQVVVLAALALAALATTAVVLAEQRYAMVRTLGTRVVISAVTYALLFRVAAWALDPDRGRSPVMGGGSVLLGSNGHVFVIVGAVAALVAVVGGVVAWRRTATRRTMVETVEQTDDDTREFAPV